MDNIRKMNLQQLRQEYIECQDTNPTRAFIIKKIIERNINYQLFLRQQQHKQQKNIPDIQEDDDFDLSSLDEPIQEPTEEDDMQELVLDYVVKDQYPDNGMKKKGEHTVSEDMNRKMMERMNSDMNIRGNLLHTRQRIDRFHDDEYESNHMQYDDILKTGIRKKDFRESALHIPYGK